MSLIKGEKFIMIIDANNGETLQSYMLKDMKLHFGLSASYGEDNCQGIKDFIL